MPTMDPDRLDRQLSDLTGLTDPVRRALYRHVVACGVAVTRDQAARAVGISRPLAAYHLDRLVDDGLLEAGFERRSGRSGPGAGRPAKVYSRSERQIELSLPARDYAAIAELLARAVEGDRSGGARAALHEAARRLGADLGAEASGRGGTAAALLWVLAERGYEPFEADDGSIRLRNCPFDRIAAGHRDLVCGANLALVEGLAGHLGADRPPRPALEPEPGRCCVVIDARQG
jgi:predicted ArsR family transcriptional regulator